MTENDHRFRSYKRRGNIEARPYVLGEDLSKLSVSMSDLKMRSLVGGMVARNPKNHEDQWYIEKHYFEEHYE